MYYLRTCDFLNFVEKKIVRKMEKEEEKAF